MATVKVERVSPTYTLTMSEDEAHALFNVIDHDGQKLSVSDLRVKNYFIHGVIEALADALDAD